MVAESARWRRSSVTMTNRPGWKPCFEPFRCEGRDSSPTNLSEVERPKRRYGVALTARQACARDAYAVITCAAFSLPSRVAVATVTPTYRRQHVCSVLCTYAR